MKENSENLEHIYNTQSDKPNYNVSIEDMLLDLKVLLKEYYCGTFTDDGKALKIKFNNGQKFLLNIQEV